MLTFKRLALVILIFSVSKAMSQNFVLQETTLDRNNSTAYFGTFKRIEMVLRKTGNVNSLPFSSKCTLTSGSFTPLSERFAKFLPASNSPDYGRVVERDFKSGKDKILKITYGLLPEGKNETIGYVQVVVIFNADSKNPQIDDIKVLDKADAGIIMFSRDEVNTIKGIVKKPVIVQQPKPATTAPAKSTTAKSTGTKSSPTKSTAKPASKPTTSKPAATKPAATKPAATKTAPAKPAAITPKKKS